MVRPYIIPHEISHHFLGSSHVRNDKHNLLTEDTDFDNLGRHNSLRKNNGVGFMTKNYSKATFLTVNRSTLYQFSIVAIKARHGDHTALDILIKKFNSLTLNDVMGVKYLPGLLGYTNHPEAVRQMLNVYNKPDIRPGKEDSLYNYCASSLNMLIPGFPSGNAFLGIIGDTVKMESYRRWIEENKDKYTINDVPFSRNKNIINDITENNPVTNNCNI